MSDSKPLRVLSIDGGGVRGVVPLHCLLAIKKSMKSQKLIDKEPHEMFDVICGTSTGGIIAIMLGILKIPLRECIGMYETMAKQVFPPDHQGSIRSYFCKATGKAQYSSEPLEREIKEQLRKKFNSEDLKMDDCRADVSPDKADGCSEKFPYVFVVATDCGRPWLFRNYQNSDPTNGESDVEIWKAARATAAAPSIFQLIEIDGKTYADGGIGYNNPIRVADLEVRRINAFRERTHKFFLSLGTGAQMLRCYEGGHCLKLANYFSKIVTATEWDHNYFHERFKHDVTYQRLNPQGFLGAISLDASEKLSSAINGTKVYLSEDETKDKVKLIVNMLTDDEACVARREPDAVDAGLEARMQAVVQKSMQALETKLQEQMKADNEKRNAQILALQSEISKLKFDIDDLAEKLLQKESECQSLRETVQVLTRRIEELNEEKRKMRPASAEYENGSVTKPADEDNINTNKSMLEVACRVVKQHHIASEASRKQIMKAILEKQAQEDHLASMLFNKSYEDDKDCNREYKM